MNTKISVSEDRVERLKKFHCAVEVALNILGGKYKAIILYHLIGHTLRFSEIHKLVAQATPKMLSQQLKELEADGIIVRKLYPVVPPKTEYSLSEYGQSIIPVVMSLHEWGKDYIEALDLNDYFEFTKES